MKTETQIAQENIKSYRQVKDGRYYIGKEELKKPIQEILKEK